MGTRKVTAALVAGGLLIAVLAVPSGSASATGVDRTRYRNCAELNAEYVDGVAKSSNWRNRGRAIYGDPEVNRRVYSLNQKLDRDRDGIICEDTTPDVG
jgi:Excalibur calcium-binding domain